ncbi:Ino eighty subunit 1 [Leucoagaricus sp. SymC.cos]|nr:Ino eighty subunit 1 [Leucoagaricus sp. SymC.cos]
MSRRASPNPRKAIPIKRVECEPLTRSDLQYDFLRNIFSDTHAIFTNPWPTPGDVSGTKLTFRDLYIKTILNSTKATKAFREKLAESDTFAEDFAMIALLVNVGRINTTMSFFPEMKTAIRSYHPVPALQRTSGNLQDAPRIKHMLKAVSVDGGANPPSNIPSDILSRLNSGHVPPTTVTNLIFGLANHSSVRKLEPVQKEQNNDWRSTKQSIGRSHLPDNVDFLDLFMKADLSSESRAKAFLWLCFNYLESSATNTEEDYDDDVIVNPFGDPRKDGKPSFVHLSLEEAAKENVDPPDEIKLAEKLIEHRASLVQGQQSKDKLAVPSSASGSVIGDADDTPGSVGEEIGGVSAKGKRKRENPPTAKKPRTTTKESATADKMPKGRRQKGTKATAVDNSFDSNVEGGNSGHAWIKVTTVDPLVDSDSDDDEYARHDYMQRLRVIAGILGTPFSDSGQPPSPSQPSIQPESTHHPRYL